MSQPAAPPGGRRTGTQQTGAQTSTLPELDVARVRRWCAARVPEHARHEMRVECEVTARHLTIVERRAPYDDDQQPGPDAGPDVGPDAGPHWTSLPIARLRYTKARDEWSLYWRDRHSRFRAYDEDFSFVPSRDVQALLAELDRDPAGIFWG